MLKLKELRIAKGLTQKQLAEILGVRNYIVANWEQNRTEPNLRDLRELADFFECSIDYLIGRENDFGQICIIQDSKEHAQVLELFDGLTPERKQLSIRFLKELKNSTEMEKRKTN